MAMMNLDGEAVDVCGEVAAECDSRSLLRLRDMIVVALSHKGLTNRKIARIFGITEQRAGQICDSVPEWQVRRCREIIDEAVCELLD